MIYEPEEDSFLLQKHIKEYIKSKSTSVLDLGCGSCIQGKQASLFSDNVTAVDINPEAGDYAEKYKLKFIYSNLFENVKEKFDLILFNPPYLPAMDEEPEDVRLITTGGKQGFELIEEFLKQAPAHLNKGGKILLICSTLTGDVEKLFKKYKFKFKKIDESKEFFEVILLYELSQ
jgi:release factor glutamine methyltransferase